VLNTAKISLQHVLNDRRKQVRARLGASVLLALSYVIVLGWHWIVLFTAGYFAT